MYNPHNLEPQHIFFELRRVSIIPCSILVSYPNSPYILIYDGNGGGKCFGGNGGGKYFGGTLTVTGTTVTSLRGSIKGVCRHVSNPTLNSVIELKKSVKKVL
jgi:hypothetical protein